MSKEVEVALIGLAGVVLTLLVTLLIAFMSLKKHINSRMGDALKAARQAGRDEITEETKTK